jgi:hypothetical protein
MCEFVGIRQGQSPFLLLGSSSEVFHLTTNRTQKSQNSKPDPLDDRERSLIWIS